MVSKSLHCLLASTSLDAEAKHMFSRPSMFLMDTPVDPPQPLAGNKGTGGSERSCPLCLQTVQARDLPKHLDICDKNVMSCEFCLEGVPQCVYHEHVVDCPMNLRRCYVCHLAFPSKALASHLQTCGMGKKLRMYHGTSLEAAKSIFREGFRPSVKGLLGVGVYVTKDPSKAKQYGPVTIECLVHVGSVAVINKKFHSLQKCWAAHGYDSAWIPPNSEVVASGLEEHCVADPKRIVPVSMASSL